MLMRYFVSPSYRAKSSRACRPSRSIAARISGLRGVIRHWKGLGRILRPLLDGRRGESAISSLDQAYPTNKAYVKSKISTGISFPCSSRAFSILNPHRRRAIVMNVPCSARPCPLHILRPQPKVMYPFSPGNGRASGLSLMYRFGFNRSGSGNSRSWWWIAQTFP